MVVVIVIENKLSTLLWPSFGLTPQPALRCV